MIRCAAESSAVNPHREQLEGAAKYSSSRMFAKYQHDRSVARQLLGWFRL